MFVQKNVDNFVERVVSHDGGWSDLWSILQQYEGPDMLIVDPAPDLGAARLRLRGSILQRMEREQPALSFEHVNEIRMLNNDSGK